MTNFDLVPFQDLADWIDRRREQIESWLLPEANGWEAARLNAQHSLLLEIERECPFERDEFDELTWKHIGNVVDPVSPPVTPVVVPELVDFSVEDWFNQEFGDLTTPMKLGKNQSVNMRLGFRDFIATYRSAIDIGMLRTYPHPRLGEVPDISSLITWSEDLRSTYKKISEGTSSDSRVLDRTIGSLAAVSLLLQRLGVLDLVLSEVPDPPRTVSEEILRNWLDKMIGDIGVREQMTGYSQAEKDRLQGRLEGFRTVQAALNDGKLSTKD